MQYFIKNKNQIKKEDLPMYPEGRAEITDFSDSIFGTRITDNQYRNAKAYGTVKIQRDNRNYFVGIKMIRRELTHKIRSYV